MAHGLEAIDWSAPWLAHLRVLGQGSTTQAGLDVDAPVCDMLNHVGFAPVHFVPQSDLPAHESYERYIFNTKRCPTRNGQHDFFNGLCWHVFPQTKARLNQLQAEQIDLLGTVATRGTVRDALTVFDENAAFLFAPPELWQALLDKDWQQLFVGLRPLWAQAQLVLFGHALLEKLVYPRKPITAHVYVCSNVDHTQLINLKTIDALIAADLSANKLSQKPFSPLPVLGVPGWWQANEDPHFYNDEAAFRKPRP